MVYGTQHVLYYSGHMVRRSTGHDVRLSGRMAYGLRDGTRPVFFMTYGRRSTGRGVRLSGRMPYGLWDGICPAFFTTYGRRYKRI